jgi:hypothetical protein
LIDYISRSYDFLKIENENGEIVYVSGSCNLPKKEIFDGLHKRSPFLLSRKLPKKEI